MNNLVRTTDPEIIQNALALYRDDIELDVDKWIACPDNVALTDDKSNVSLFEYSGLMTYTGHYFFVDRGRKAIDIGVEMLNLMFDTYRTEVIKGLTPLEHRPARWMARKLGFKSYGVINTISGPCELFILTRVQFRNQ